MSNKFTCPYCLYSFHRNEVLIRQERKYDYHCPNPAEIGGSGLPVCQKVLPPNFLNSKSITIALAGDTYAGKSYFQLALLHELRFNKTLFKMGISGEPVGVQPTIDRINQLFEEIHNGRKLKFTTLVEDPFLIQLNVKRNGKLSTIYFSFYDNPGGWFNNTEQILNDMPNIHNADGIIFLIDPIEIEHLWEDLIRNNPYIIKRKPKGIFTPINNVTQVLSHVRNSTLEDSEMKTDSSVDKRWKEILNKLGISSNNQIISTPVAFTISKFDQLKNNIGENIPYDSNDMEIMCMKNGVYDKYTQVAISSDIRQVLFDDENGDSRLKDIIDSNYKDAEFFACKSVKVDEKTGEPEELEPQGVLLPLIWILNKLKLY